jgi:predicted nucleic acid-binding protein
MNQRLYLDANVILDLLGEREPFYDSAAKIASLADRQLIVLVVSSLSYSILFYVLSKFEDRAIVIDKIRKFKVLVETSELTEKIVDKALVSKFTDFEDALQYHCALESDCQIIISRDQKGFKNSEIPVLTPDEFLMSLEF